MIVGCVRSIPVRPGGLRIRSVVVGPFPCALDVYGFVLVRCVHSRAPWVSSVSFEGDRSIPGGRRVC